MIEQTKILYVDDEAINLKLFKYNFRKKYDVLTAENGIQGLRILEEYPDVSIIISDMNMPEMNGIEFVKIAKKRFPQKKYYILTGFAITKEIQNALKSGLIAKYFKKPFKRNEIEEALL